MKHLTCYCLTFYQMDVDLIKSIKNRVEEEVLVAERLYSRWFHLSRKVPQASDPGVPSIHYHQIVEPPSFDMPRFWIVNSLFLINIPSLRKIVRQYLFFFYNKQGKENILIRSLFSHTTLCLY